jgi:hypothetical protein
VRPLKIPAVLAVAVLTGAAAATLVSTSSCTDDDEPDTCFVRCFPDGMGGGANCRAPDYPCATGSNMDQCPSGCVPEPLV